MGSGVQPASIDGFGLFAEAECDSKSISGKIADAPQDALDINGVLLRLDFTGLKNDGAVALLKSPACHAYRVVLGDPVAFHRLIAAPDTAVITVFRTAVAQLDQSAQRNEFAGYRVFQLTGGLKKFGLICQ